MSLRSRVASLFAEHTKLSADEVEALIEIPPQPSLGDFAFPCFTLAKTMRKAPAQIAQEIAHAITAQGSGKGIESAVATGPYVNVFVSIKALASEALSASSDVALPQAQRQVICIESPAPNTNKPLHLGHVRNMLLGVAVRMLLACRGHTVHALDLVNDRGVHICKSMLAYERAGRNDSPESTGMKGDHFVGGYYVEFSKAAKENPALEEEAQAMLLKWEQGDPQVRALWKKMRTWCLDGFQSSYKEYGVAIEKTYYESEIYMHGKELVLDALKKGIFTKDEKGAVVADLTSRKLDTKVLLRSDGTAIYITQDIALAQQRFDEYHMDRLVYVVGNEQNYHFKVLFSIFEMLGYPFAKNCFHMSYGYVSLPSGRMKSREGTVVDADDLRAEMIAMAAEEVRKRSPDLPDAEINRRAVAIGMGALRFYILKYDPLRDFVYDPQESISFAGETGPYVQYTYARIQSIFRKARGQGGVDLASADVSFLVEPLEKELLAKLNAYAGVLASAADKYSPYLVAVYALELAQLANKYYHDTQVLVPEEHVKIARLKLLDTVAHTIKDALGVLSIDVLDEM